MAEVTFNSKFGRAVFITVRVYQLRVVLEIGSCDGDGSTQVLAEAMRPFVGHRLVCLEIDEERFGNLRRNVAAMPWIEPRQESSISWGAFTLRDFENDVWSRHPSRDEATRERVHGYWLRDCRYLKGVATGYLERDQTRFDATLLDGGVFTGDDEFRLLRERTDCFMLDDVFSGFKNARVEAILRDDRDWKRLFADRTERLGTAIYVRKTRQPSASVKLLRTAMAWSDFYFLSLRSFKRR